MATKKKGETMLKEAKASEEKDPVFGDTEGDAGAPVEKKKGGKVPGRLIQPDAKELADDDRRKHDNRIGLLIGPKNLVKLRTFGYEVSMVNPDGLASGVAHRGMNE